MAPAPAASTSKSADGGSGAGGGVAALVELFPLTHPLPNPLTDPELVPLNELALEVDLVRSAAGNLSRWMHHIANVQAGILQSEKEARGSADPAAAALLGRKLSSAAGRIGLRRLTDIHERTLVHFPTSFKLWKQYLDVRCSYVLGQAKHRVNLKAPRTKRSGGGGDNDDDGSGGGGGGGAQLLLKVLNEGVKDVESGEAGAELSENERDVDAVWEGGLDGVVGAEEWKSLAGVFERALRWLPRMPRIWLNYLNIFLHPSCPSFLLHSHARRTFDRALRVLPKSQHERIWRLYLKYAQDVAVPTVSTYIFRRFLKVDPSVTEHYVKLLLAGDPAGSTRPLEAAKLLLKLSRLASEGKYKSPTGKSPYNLLIQWMEVVEAYPEEVGISDEDAQEYMKQRVLRAEREEVELNKRQQEAEEAASDNAAAASSTTADGLIRFAGPPQPAQTNGASEGQRNADSRVDGEEAARREAEEYMDASDPKKLDVEDIVRRDALAVYKDQAGRVWTGLATYWIKRGDFDKARQIFEEGIATVLTVRDFTQIFDSYAEFYESSISALMDAVADEEEGSDEAKETEAELDVQMRDFEALMDRRPFLVNDVLLRRNPNDVQEWEKRVALWGTNDDEIQKTYENAIATINARKALGSLHRLFINYAKFFEEGGASADPEERAERDIASARKIFEKATKVNFKKVDDLAEVWCEWAEMEVRNENYDEAIRVMQRATISPKKINTVDYHDDNLLSQTRLFKSLKLWSFYVDLEESIGSVETAKKAYDRIFELKIANAQVVINYANFLEENDYFEESFKVYERGISLFGYPIAFELWNIFLARFLRRYKGTKLERTRDLFEQAITDCPEKFAKPIYLMYGQFEEDFGMARRAMNIYNRATEAVESKDRFEMYEVLVSKTTANFGLPAARAVYEKALEALPDKHASEMCLRFGALERKLGEIDRARAIYAYGSQFCDPRIFHKFWQEWNAFEVETGSEDTFREMLRIKRAVQASFNTSSGYLAARAAAAKKGLTGQAAADAAQGGATSNATNGAPANAMAALEASNRPSSMSFVPAKERVKTLQEQQAAAAAAGASSEETAPDNNTDEIAIEDDDE